MKRIAREALPKTIRAIDQDLEFPLFEGMDHQRSFTYVGDICRAVLLALDGWDRAVGEIFNVGRTGVTQRGSDRHRRGDFR